MSRIDEWFNRHFPRLRDRLRAQPDGEDIAQETMIAAWQREEQPDNEWSYLFVSARNRLRKRMARASVPKHGGGKVTQLEAEHDAHDERRSAEDELIGRENRAEARAIVDEVMAELSPETRQAYLLRLRGYAPHVIAQIVGLTDQAVRTRVSRTSARLRERIFGDDDDHSR